VLGCAQSASLRQLLLNVASVRPVSLSLDVARAKCLSFSLKMIRVETEFPFGEIAQRVLKIAFKAAPVQA
jgi:hypothetical protein